MSTSNILVLPGDGIGPEVIESAIEVLNLLANHAGMTLNLEYADFGGISIDNQGTPATDETLRKAKEADAVLLGAVGGPKWDDLPSDKRPERGLLQLRAALDAFCNLRPAKLFKALADSSPLRPERAGNFDFIVVRELTGGIYFGEPRGIEGKVGSRRGVNSMVYTEDEILRIGRVAFELAQRREKRLVSVDKANVLEVQALWRSVMTELNESYPDVALSHLYVDNCAMQLTLNPCQFDVLVSGNMFGDILSDEAAALTGSLGMLPSASVGEGGAIYEPVHGSAPDIAGKNMANPLAMILSVGMMMGNTFKQEKLETIVEDSVEAVLALGLRTPDIYRPNIECTRKVGTDEIGKAVINEIRSRLS